MRSHCVAGKLTDQSLRFKKPVNSHKACGCLRVAVEVVFWLKATEMSLSLSLACLFQRSLIAERATLSTS